MLIIYQAVTPFFCKYVFNNIGTKGIFGEYNPSTGKMRYLAVKQNLGLTRVYYS